MRSPKRFGPCTPGGVNSSPTEDASDEGSASPSEEALWQLYKIAVDEYRFQVNLNWQRLQYFLGLNVAILGVGAGLLRVGTAQDQQPSNVLPGLVFLAGVGLSAAAWYLARRQQDYYRNARNRMTKIGKRLGIHELGVGTTAGARGEPSRPWAKVRVVNQIVLAGLAVLNGIGAWFAFFK